jgi:hypothetical protein
MSQCTPCPANSWADNPLQTNISACLCNAGSAGDSVSGCVECALNTSAARNSKVCTPCSEGTFTYEYPRATCQCHKGYAPNYQVTNGVSRTYSYWQETNIVMLRGELDSKFSTTGSYGWYPGDNCGYANSGPCARMTVDLGKIENVAGFVIQHSCDGSTKCGKYVERVQVEYSELPDSGFVQAQSSYNGGVDFHPNNHLSKPYRNYYDKIWQLFASPVRARYIKFNPMLNNGQNAFFRAGVIIWPNLACSACPLNTFKNYTGNRSMLYDLNVLSECQSCPYLSSTTMTGSSSCSCSPGAYIDSNRGDASVCRGCGLGMYLSNHTCVNCLNNTFASEYNAQMCMECNNASFVQDHPRFFCLCNHGFTSEIVEVNPPDNMRYFSYEHPGAYSGIDNSRSRLDAYWIHGAGGGFGGWVALYGSTAGSWLAMDLGFLRRVYGVVIQSGGSGYGGGYCNAAYHYVTAVSVEHSMFRDQGFENAKNQANNDIMFYPVNIGDSSDCVATRKGCTEACSARRSNNIFQEPVMARYIKIRVWNWIGTITMRAGVLIVSDNCLPCPANTFKDYAGLSKAGMSCTACQPGSVSHPGSSRLSQCNCSAGYFRNDSTSCPSCAGGTSVSHRTFCSARRVHSIHSLILLFIRGTTHPTVVPANSATRRRTRLSQTTMMPRGGAWAAEKLLPNCARSVHRRRHCFFRQRRASATSACAAACAIRTSMAL